MKIRFHIVYCFIIVVLVILLSKPFAKSDRVNDLDNSVIDTLSFKRDTTKIVIIDTIIQERVVYKERIVKDTLWLTDTLYLPIVQKHYSEQGKYDLWISGVEPLNVDKIDIYNTIEYNTITNTITQAIYPKNTQVFMGGGFCSFLGTFTPLVSISIETRRKWLFSLDYGRNKQSNLIVVDVKYKIIGK